MLFQSLFFLSAACLLQLQASNAAGYHYDRPNIPSSGHGFAPLPTVRPLPPVPALPPLPTARSHVQTQTLLQVHPPTQQKSIAAAYRPPSYQPHQTYLPASGSSGPSGPGAQRSAVSHITQAYQQPQLQAPRPPTPTFGQRIATPQSFSNPGASFGPSAPASGGPQASPQPLRIPFGKQAVIHYPTATAPANNFYTDTKGRQLKQYAVIEIIDNDIEQSMQPFLSNSFFDTYRAHIGATGTGAHAFDTTGSAGFPASGGGGNARSGVQLNSRSNALVLEQQRLPQQQRGGATGDAIALGSGGLGYVRLPNGNVYLGSGSLAFVSGQQRTQRVNDARTRHGANTPDAVHFGHGALGGGFRYK